MTKYYDELLLLCGYEQEEIENERGRLEECWRRLGLSTKDFDTAVEWVKEHYQIEMKGVRMLLGAYLKELTDMMLAGDEGRKCVYFGFPAMLGPGLALSSADKNHELQIGAPDVILAHTMGLIFNKLAPIIQAGEQNGLAPAQGFCSLWQTKIGAISLGLVPPPAFNFSSGYFCDMSAVGDDLLRGKYGSPAGIIDCCMDGRFGEYPYFTDEKVEFLAKQIQAAMEKAQEVLNIKVADSDYKDGMKNVFRFMELTKQIVDLNKSDPVPLSVTTIELMESAPGASTGRGIVETIKAMEVLIPEVEELVRQGKGVLPKGSPRVVILHGQMADPRISKMCEDAGLAVPVTYITAWNGGLKLEVPKQYDDLFMDMAALEIVKGMPYGADGVLQMLLKASRTCDVDGFVEKHLVHCRPASMQSRLAKTYLEENSGLPVLNMDEDMVDNRVYNHTYMKTKIDTFAEMLKAKKNWAKVDTVYDD